MTSVSVIHIWGFTFLNPNVLCKLALSVYNSP